MELEKNARLVSQFTSKIRNLSRISELADAFIDMATSGAWRDYRFATGHFRWRASEFDYFLIANGVRRDDAARVLAYNKRAKELLPLMDSDSDKRKRRPFEQAAKEYQSADSLNTDLVATAAALGWINGARFSDVQSTAKGSQIPIKSPVPRFTSKNRGARLNRWKVDWSDDRTAAQAVFDKLQTDQELYSALEKMFANARRQQQRKVS